MVECVNCRTDEADSGSQRHTVGHPSQGTACKSGMYFTVGQKKTHIGGSLSSAAEGLSLLGC
jgi:hypothetical protein